MTADSRAPFQSYVNQVRPSFRFSDPLGSAYSGAFVKSIAPPTLNRSQKNRIIYYIGSFNPPHLGHLAIIEHIATNVLASHSSAQKSNDDDSLRALALIVIPHAQTWIDRKLRKESKSGSAESLHLNFKQRSTLVRQGLPEQLVRRNVWLFPDDLGEWWVFQTHLLQACQKDGYELEFIELLGPDYVSWQRPKCSGQHGVVTSNICRETDFDTGDGLTDLTTLDGFDAWKQVVGQDVDNMQAVLDTSSQSTSPATGRRDAVWVCTHKKNTEYRIWFVQRDIPTLDKDLSSTHLRKLIATTEIDRLEDALQAYALSPKQLIQYIRKQKKN